MRERASRIAALYDVHGNLPTVDAVLSDLKRVRPDLVVVGGDVAADPMPVEVLDRLGALGEGVRFVRGNADREVVAAYGGDWRDAVSDDAANRAWRAASWTASRIDRRHRDLLASFAEWLVVEVEGLGEVMFCHGSPRSDEEIVTTATTEERFREILAGISHNLIV